MMPDTTSDSEPAWQSLKLGTQKAAGHESCSHEVHAVLRFLLEPVVIAVRRQDHHHALFIHRLVKLAHAVMAIGIDGQYGEVVQRPKRD